MNPPDTPTIAHFLRQAAAALRDAAAQPHLDAQCLLAHALGRDRAYVLTWSDAPLPPALWARAMELVRRRAQGEPVAYLTGKREFYGREFTVTPATLIPRPETERLVEAALDFDADACLFADLGTGSGCILATLLAERPRWRGLGIDLSGPALTVAKANARAHGVESRALLARGDFAARLVRGPDLDLLVSNPPYVSEAEYPGLMRDVRAYEPRSALVPRATAGTAAHGLEAVAGLERRARDWLRPGGLLLVEIGASQGGRALELLEAAHWKQARILLDLAGRGRVLTARRTRVK